MGRKRTLRSEAHGNFSEGLDPQHPRNRSRRSLLPVGTTWRTEVQILTLDQVQRDSPGARLNRPIDHYSGNPVAKL